MIIEIKEFDVFYIPEQYHQNYEKLHSENRYKECFDP